ncbi:MAG: hypothetical protein NC833_01350 [Candidatus Omnitrophica bacterium]|nr:hypothetical protein [Candidatus Omnitrophota bacterium]
MKNKDIKIYYYKSRGPGGQRKNKKLISVKVVHIPTGITAIGREFPFQFEEKKKRSQKKKLRQKIKIEDIKSI